jgi:hypothetical protein
MHIYLYISLTVYVVLGGFVIFILMRNSGAPDALQNTSILIVGLLPALIAVVPYLNPTKKSKEFSYYLFFNEGTGTALSLPFSPYGSAYFNAFSHLDPQHYSIEADGSGGGEEQQKWLSEIQKLGFDLIERMIVQNLVSHFGMQWDLTFSKRTTPFGQAQSGRTNSGITGTKISMVDVQRAFPHNPLIPHFPSDRTI